MKWLLSLTTLITSCLLSLMAFSQPCNLSGTYSIGPGGNYASITQALDTLRSRGVGGPVILELASGYTPSSETFPILFGGIPCISQANNLTLRPRSGSGLINIGGGSTTNPTVNLSNARYITIDGRPGGTGNASSLTFSNALGTVFNLSNDASFNILTYLAISGGTGISFSGSTNTITNGNSNNVISYCSITNATKYGIYSAGAANKKNTHNKVTGCSISDYFSSSSANTVCGIYLKSNSGQWEISGNSFFQTIVATSFSTARSYGIYIDDTTSSNFLIENNFIGGKAPACGGAALVYRGNYTGISVACSNSSFSIIRNNTVSNISWSNQEEGEIFTGIKLAGGKIDCYNNTIGSQTQRSKILSTSTYPNHAYLYGISVNPPTEQSRQDTFLVRRNSIGGVKLQRDATNYAETYFSCIYGKVNRSYLSIANNILGSLTVPGSIESVIQGEEFKGVYVVVNDTLGQPNSANPLKFYVDSNTITNFHGKVRGIETRGGSPQVTSNTISAIVNGGLYGDTDIFTSASITGAIILDEQAGTRIWNNKMYDFSGTVNNTGISMVGIAVSYATGLDIANNLVHSFSTVYAGNLAGIYVDNSGSLTSGLRLNIYNNMISLGNDSPMVARAYKIQGITAPLNNTTISNNSVNITGNGPFDRTTTALYVTGVASPPNRVVNNIFQNNRVRNSSVSFTYGSLIEFVEEVEAASGFYFNNNIYYSNQPNINVAVLRYNNTVSQTLNAWRFLSHTDSSSFFTSPNFINENGGKYSSNLHLANPTPAESHGLNEPLVTDDIDREIRSSLTPVDIGADAGDFVFRYPSTTKLLCPGSSFNIVSDITTGASFQWQADTGTGFANIQDNIYYSGTNTNTLHVTNIPSSWYGYLYRCSINGAFSNAFNIKFTNQWLGTVSSEWENPANWSCGILPDGNTDVVIASGSVVLGSNGVCRSISISSTASFTVATGFSLTITH